MISFHSGFQFLRNNCVKQYARCWQTLFHLNSQNKPSSLYYFPNYTTEKTGLQEEKRTPHYHNREKKITSRMKPSSAWFHILIMSVYSTLPLSFIMLIASCFSPRQFFFEQKKPQKQPTGKTGKDLNGYIIKEDTQTVKKYMRRR